MATESLPAGSSMETLVSRLIELQEETNKQLKQIKRRLPAADAAESDEDKDEE